MIWIILLLIWLLSIIVYFFSLRTIISRDIDVDVSGLEDVIKIVVLGFIPVVNIFYICAIIIDYFEYKADTKGIDILKKILFIKEKRDERWR